MLTSPLPFCIIFRSVLLALSPFTPISRIFLLCLLSLRIVWIFALLLTFPLDGFLNSLCALPKDNKHTHSESGKNWRCLNNWMRLRERSWTPGRRRTGFCPDMHRRISIKMCISEVVMALGESAEHRRESCISFETAYGKSQAQYGLTGRDLSIRFLCVLRELQMKELEKGREAKIIHNIKTLCVCEAKELKHTCKHASHKTRVLPVTGWQQLYTQEARNGFHYLKARLLRKLTVLPLPCLLPWPWGIWLRSCQNVLWI